MERIVKVRTGKEIRFMGMTEEEVKAAGLDTAEEWSRTASGHYAIADRYLNEIVEQDDGWEDLYLGNRLSLYTVEYCNKFHGRYLAPQAAAEFRRLARTACPTEVIDPWGRVVASWGNVVDEEGADDFRDEVGDEAWDLRPICGGRQ